MTPDQLLALLRAIGGTGHIEHGDGYSRVVEQVGETQTVVFDPVNNSAQAFDVFVWLCRTDVTAYVTTVAVHFNGTERISHNGSSADIRRAVAEAAVRVVEGE